MYSLTTNSQDTNDPDYFTCYGRDVKKVASDIAIAHIALAAFLFLAHLISREGYIFLSFPISTLVILAGFVVIYADRKAKAWAYIPFLVVQHMALLYLNG
uniref:Uncharacterized protein n=1 Tax=Acrobeloides nanus TaxID=290746 RepID=A0A914DRL4_9BILA